MRDARQPRGAARSVAVAAGSIAVLTLLARAVGFGRWVVFSHTVGATCVGSVYQSVNTVPNVLFEIAAGGVLAAVVVPLVSAALGRGDRAHADATASALLTWAVVVLTPLAGLVALAARPVAALLVGGDGSCPDALALGADLLRVFAVQIPLYGVGIVLSGVLQAHGRFTAPALAPLLSSLLVIVTYAAYRTLVADPAAPVDTVSSTAIAVLGAGTSAGVLALSAPLLLPARRAGIRLRPTLRFPDGVSRRVRRLATAGVLALTGQQLATVVVIRVANDRGGPGTLNVFTYAQAVSLLPYAVLAVPLATAAFPALAGQAALEEAEPTGAPVAAATLRGTWLATLLAGLLSAALLVAIARPVGAFFTWLDAGRESAAGVTALQAIPPTLVALAPGVLALCVIALLSRALYVRGRARMAGVVVALGWAATTALPLTVLRGSAGPAETLAAVATGSSLGLLAAAAGLVVLTRRAWGSGALDVPWRPLGAGTAAAVVSATGGWWLGGMWRPGSLGAATLACAVSGGFAVVVFALVAALLDRSVPDRMLRRRRSLPVEETA
ncbi:MAG TPA: lipid II flippase MurJ [Intrasporangium sp.]|uniref:murein biosynthesis integral membrane protein MurJ n=1 Tax=Intrasporangium sp. TaxID=1925024 RepID=UPI002D79EA46|nr:lipid II flippase MurJ [Intrasporangium sp.]HET7396914.1 lipid II flippase MurJ [Intrasporangium sp.]